MNELDLYEVDTLELLDDDSLAVLEPEPEIIDADYTIVPTEPAPLAKRERQDLAVVDSEPEIIDTTAYEIAPAKRETLSTFTETHTALSTYTETSAPVRTRQPVDTFFAWLSPAKAKASPPSPVYRWRYVAEADPNEPEHVQHLRYFWLLQQYGTLVSEWSEADFWEWLEELSDTELAMFADAGREIAEGRLYEHLDEDMQAAFDAVDDDSDVPIGFFERIAKWL